MIVLEVDAADTRHYRGGYPKFEEAGENDNYLPHWLSAAGYTTECMAATWVLRCGSPTKKLKGIDIGKLFNGNSFMNYHPGPKGWHHIDVLVRLCSLLWFCIPGPP